MKRYHIEIRKLQTPEELLASFQQLMGKLEVSSEQYDALDERFKSLCIEVEEEEEEDTTPHIPWYRKVGEWIMSTLILAGVLGGLAFFFLVAGVLITQ